MAGPIDPRTLAIIQAMEPAAAQRQATMARDAVMRGPAPAPMNPVFRPGQDAAPVMPAGLTIAPQGGMPPGFDQFADVRNPIPQPRGPMTAPQPSAADLMPPQAAGRMQPMPQSFETPIGPAPSRMVPPPMPMPAPAPAPGGNMLAPDVEETGSVAPQGIPSPDPQPMVPPTPGPSDLGPRDAAALAPVVRGGHPAADRITPQPGNLLTDAPTVQPSGNRLEAPAPTGRRVYDPAAGTNGPRFIYEGGPAPMRAAGGGSAIATGGGAVPATGGAGGAAMPYSGGDSGGGMGDGFFDFLGGFSRGGLLGGIQGVRLGKQARAKAGLSAQQENMTRQAAKRLGVPDDVANSLDGKSLASLVIDIQKQNMRPKEAKAPNLQEIYTEGGGKQKGYFDANSKWVAVGAVDADEGATPKREVRTIYKDGKEITVSLDPATGQYIQIGDEKPGDRGSAFDTEQKLRKEYTATPEYARFNDVRSSYDRVATASEQDNGPGDIAMVYGYMKMLDPGSVVREGEFATAEQTTGLPGYVVNLYNKAISGTRLTPEQRAQFVDMASQFYDGELSRLNEINTRYSQIAEASDLDPSRIIVAPAARPPKKKKEPEGPAGTPSVDDIDAELKKRGLL
jgi:hypothetical protein